MYNFSLDYAKVRERIVYYSEQYFQDNGIKALVIGMSGGIDSALVAALMSEIKIPLIGVRIPLSGNKPDEMNRAKLASTTFCSMDIYAQLDWISLGLMRDIIPSQMIHCTGKQCSDAVMAIRMGNIKARIRMIQLFDIARANDGLVLSTDNLTEYMLGFWTLHGDVGNFGPIQNLWKTEVYKLSEFLYEEYRKKEEHIKATAMRACIDAMPTDGLGITESDFDQILPGQDVFKTPAQRYQEVDEILIRYRLGEKHLVDNPVIRRHLASEFKRRDPASLLRTLMLQKGDDYDD